jgi:hypothetical protein
MVPDALEISTIIEEIIQAHGGSELWDSLNGLEVRISAWGFLFKVKHIPVLEHTRVWLSTQRPHLIFYDFPRAGQTGEFIGDEVVQIRESNGQVLQSRSMPRAAFRGLRRNLWWDSLDFRYFMLTISIGGYIGAHLHPPAGSRRCSGKGTLNRTFYSEDNY